MDTQRTIMKNKATILYYILEKWDILDEKALYKCNSHKYSEYPYL